jgi:uncharacterized membrane protein YjdF
MSPHSLIAIVASVIIVVLGFVGTVPTYRVAPALVLPLLWGAYFLRGRLRLHPFHFGLFAAALVLHMLGTFGFYQRSFFGLSFDIYVHFYFAFAVACVLERFFRESLDGRRWAARVGTLMFMMGFGALHEIMEYGSYLLLGEERGMLKPSTSYVFDTQRDLLNNLLGTVAALALIALARWVRRDQPDDSAAGAPNDARYDAPTS